MNLSESTIAHLEKKAYLRGLEDAVQIFRSKSNKGIAERELDKQIEQLSIELGEQEEA